MARQTLFEMKAERASALDACEKILARAEAAKRQLNDGETELYDEHMGAIKKLSPQIEKIESLNSMHKFSLPELLGAGAPGHASQESGAETVTAAEGRAKASQYRGEFSQFVNRALQAIGGAAPKIEAADPSGVISIGSGEGADSVGSTVSTQILQYIASYANLDSFALAGAFQINTDHTRPLFQPILSAGAADSVFAENVAPTVSQPFGLSGFTFHGDKYSRLVLASYEALMNSELPLSGAILDELLSSLATTFTVATTTKMYAALTTAIGSTQPLAVGGSGSIYRSMINLRHAVPPRYDNPTNKWMLSQATLAKVRDTRASDSGVPMFDPNANQIFGREVIINAHFDSVCGSDFVAYGNWAEGAFVRKTPVFTRVFQERYAEAGQIGFRTMQFLDSHFLAELVGAAQPPSNQPLYYASLAGES